MMISDLKIGTQLRLGLGTILLITAGLAVITGQATDNLWQQTALMYEHPLKTRRAVGNFETDVLRINNGMSNLLLAENDAEFETTLQSIAVIQTDAFHHLTLLRSSYLGSPEDIQALHDGLVQWSVSRAETIQLLRNGNRSAANARTKLGGASDIHVSKLLTKTRTVIDAARNNADEIYLKSQAQNELIDRQILVVLIGVALLTWLTFWFLLKGVRDPLAKLAQATEHFRQGKLDGRITHTSGNEFGALGSSFNAMADAIQMEMQINGQAAQLAGVMLQEEEVKSFCRELLRTLLTHNQAQVGVVYFLNEEQTFFEHFESIGLSANARTAFSATAREGEFGMLLATNQIQHIRDIPADSHFTFFTASGDFQPRELLTIPILAKQNIVAVIALASIHRFDEASIRLIHGIQNVLSARMNGVLEFRKVKDLATQLNERNSELDAQRRQLSMQAIALNQQNMDLTQQKLEIVEANRLKSVFLSSMSHELRTPLNSVIALTGVLRRRLSKSIADDENNYLEVIERNGKHLLTLINDILDLSRIESGREALKIRQFAVPQLINELLDMLAVQAQEKGIALINQTARDLPLMTSDPTKCRHIVQNLLANAVKFTEQGHVSISAEVAGEPAELRIAVIDTGIGIGAEAQSYIFDEFRQVDQGNSRKYAGTGLGLAIAKKYAQLLGGDIQVVSAPQRGSTFTLRLPLLLSLADSQPEPATDSNVPAHNPQRPTGALLTTGQRRASNIGKTVVLVVDDNPDSLLATKTLLGERYQVLEARDGQAGLEQARNHRPDIILMDISMPVMDGIQALQAIRADITLNRTRVIALTASAMMDDKETILAHGFDAYLTKPLDTELLQQALCDVLD
jgi:signal transduction histidine kinase